MSDAAGPVRLGDYELESELGRGAVGRVFRARETTTGAARAVKIVDAAIDLEALERFEREASALEKIGGAGVVRLHRSGSERGRPYLVMDLMTGGSLRDRLRRSPGGIPWREAALMVAKLARTLGRCAARGLVHRDVKPENVLFDDHGEPLLADFGCVRDLSQSRMTATGTILGTPGYMAPEQLDGRPVDARADVYALGVLLHELVTGQLPFEGASLVALARAIRSGHRPSLGETSDAPRELDALAGRALAFDASLRPDAFALASALEAVAMAEERAKGKGRPGGAARWLAASGLAAAALALVARAAGPSLSATGPSVADALAAVRAAREPLRAARLGLPATGSVAALESAVASLERLAAGRRASGGAGAGGDGAPRPSGELGAALSEARSALACGRAEAALARGDAAGALDAVRSLAAESGDRRLLEGIAALSSGDAARGLVLVDSLADSPDPRLGAEALLAAVRGRILGEREDEARERLEDPRVAAAIRRAGGGQAGLEKAAGLLRSALQATLAARNLEPGALDAAAAIAPLDSALAARVLRSCARDASREVARPQRLADFLEAIFDRDPAALEQPAIGERTYRLASALYERHEGDDLAATLFVLANAADPARLPPYELYQALWQRAGEVPDPAGIRADASLVKLGFEPRDASDTKRRREVYEFLTRPAPRETVAWPDLLLAALLGPRAARDAVRPAAEIAERERAAVSILDDLGRRRLPRQAAALVAWARALHLEGGEPAPAAAALLRAIDLGWARPDKAWLELAEVVIKTDPERAREAALAASAEGAAILGLSSTAPNPHALGCALWPPNAREEVLLRAKAVECAACLALGKEEAFDAALSQLDGLDGDRKASVRRALEIARVVARGNADDAERLLETGDQDSTTLRDTLKSLAEQLGGATPLARTLGELAAAAGAIHDRHGGLAELHDAVTEKDLAIRAEAKNDARDALAAWYRVLDSCPASEAERGEAARNVRRLRALAPPGDPTAADRGGGGQPPGSADATTWRVEVRVFTHRKTQSGDFTATEQDVAEAQASFLEFTRLVAARTRGLLTIEPHVEVVPQPIVRPRTDALPGPNDLPRDFATKTRELGALDSVFVYVPAAGPARPEGGPTKRVLEAQLATDGAGFASIAFRPGELAAHPGEVELAAWLEHVHWMFVVVQGWPRALVPRTDVDIDLVTDRMWRSASMHVVSPNPWNGGDVRRWRLHGPTPWTGEPGAGLDVAVPASASLVEAPTARSLRLDQIPGEKPAGPLAALVETWAYVPAAENVVLWVGYAERCRVRVNGEVVLEARAPRAILGVDVRRVDVALRRGWNAIAIQVERDKGQWGVSLRILDGRGRSPPRGLRLSAEPRSND